MTTAILVLQSLALLGLLILLFRKRIIIHPASDWAIISENYTREYWNNLIAIENGLFDQPLFKLSDHQVNNPKILSDAFSKTADAYYSRSKQLGSLDPFGVDPRLYSYAIQASMWISRRAANYQEWAEAIESDSSAPQEEAWLSVAKGAIKGAIAGYLGGIDAVFDMLAGDRDTNQVREINLAIARIQHDASILEAERMTLFAIRDGIAKHLVSQFNWTFEETK